MERVIDFSYGDDKEIRSGLEKLASYGYFKFGYSGLRVKLCHLREGYSVDKVNKNVILAYDTIADFYFAFALLLANYDQERFVAEGKRKFNKLYAFVDCSRNAVRKIETIKELINKAVLYGYNGLYLYLEDTYEINNQPYFGYLRGAYSKEELKEIVEYAESFNFEIIPAIQTLAHLTTLLRWDSYYNVSDTPDILLVGEEKTYALIDDMLSSLRQSFKTNKINLGMDEAHYIGLGAYLNKHGYTERKQIMIKHIKTVLSLCEKHGFDSAFIWSDMLVNKSGKDNEKSQELFESIIKDCNVKLTPAFWEYYETNYSFYDKILKQNLALSKEATFTCGGGFTWFGYAPNNKFANKVNGVSLACAADNSVKEVTIACWYDGGAEGSIFNGLASLIFAGTFNYSCENTEEKEWLAKLTTEYSFDALEGLDYPNYTYEDLSEPKINSSSKYLLYGDILLGSFDKNINEKFPKYYKRAIDFLSSQVGNKEYSYLFETMLALVKVLKTKTEIQLELKGAYKEKNFNLIKKIIDKLGDLSSLIKEFYQKVIYSWEKENKPFGCECLDLKIGGLIQRTKHVKKRLENYVDGKESVIPELEKERLNYLSMINYDYVPDDKQNCNMVAFTYHELITGGIL